MSWNPEDIEYVARNIKIKCYLKGRRRHHFIDSTILIQ
jgi:hypothetical protein